MIENTIFAVVVGFFIFGIMIGIVIADVGR